MKQTTNYGLKKPDSTDVVDIQDLNGNADKIDEKIKENADTIASHSAETMHQIILLERDMSLDGIQIITTDQKPKKIEIRANVFNTPKASIGSYEELGGQSCVSWWNGTITTYPNALRIVETAADGTMGDIQNISENSFEITWTKHGTGATGTAQIQIICYYH